MATDGETEPVNRRQSGRTVRKPGVFSEEQHLGSVLNSSSTKRKRISETNGALERDDDEDDVDETSSDDESNESEPDEEELRDKRRQKKKRPTTTKPAAKRTKTTNGASTTLAIRSAGGPAKVANKTVKAQKARSRPSQVNATGLYADVYGRGNKPEEAASIWHDAMEKDNVGGIRDLVNFILQCIECDTEIESADVEDIDNVPTRLADVLEEYARQNSTDYPLGSKLKQYNGFKLALTEFFNAIVHALHRSGMLYQERAIYDNIHIWTATMSAAGYRPFRHTATVISLAMTTALCQVAQDVQESISDTKKLIEGEKKKKSVNKGRSAKLQETMKQEEQKLEHIDELLQDAFDTVYVHRYRDVDEKIRVECVTALGRWIELYRKKFLEGQYLRYLGWVMSDPNAQTRLEVIRALKSLFKERKNIGALRAFTDRFRERMVEIGSRDTDTSVRVEAIELLDRLRNAELLKAEDVDTVGQLIFDNEPRVRKAVSKFFVSNIQDLYDISIEELDQEQFTATLPNAKEVEDFLEPCQAWIKFKCLAQTLASHDKDNESRKSGERDQDVYGTDSVESRYMLATQSIYQFMPELQEWESLAGYILFDHSTIAAEADSADIEVAVQSAFKLETGEDTILLDVLYCSVKLTLQQIPEAQSEKKGKRTQAGKDEIRKNQESAAHHLTLIIPQLLNKFGGGPEAAASILRLEQLLDIDLIGELQTEEGSYVNILEDINKQFTSHNDRKVLAEASKAFRAARTYETSQEAVDTKVAEIWSESKRSINSLLQGKNVTTRGTIDRNILRELGDVMGRLAQLAVVSDCTEVIERKLNEAGGQKSKARGANQDTFLEVLMKMTERGVADEQTTEQFAELEDKICGSVLTVLSLYFRWRIVGLKNSIDAKDNKKLSAGSLTNLAMQRSSLIEAVHPVIASRQPLDPLRVNATLTLLDLFTLFATTRHMKPAKGDLDDDIQANLKGLVTTVPSDLIKLIMETHEKMEKRLSRKTRKRIELPLDEKRKPSRLSDNVDPDNQEEAIEDVEKPPEDSEDEAGEEEDSDEDESDDQETTATGVKGKEAKKQSALIAEQSLCELTSKLVLATIAGVTGADGKIKARLQVNRTRLGKSYTGVIAYLDEKKAPKKKMKEKEGVSNKTKSSGVDASAKKAKEQKSEALVIEDDDIEDDEMELPDDRIEEGDAEDLRRKGLEDDIEDDAGEGDGEQTRVEAAEDDDEIMGD